MGYLNRQFGATTTARSHVDVQFVDDGGKVLQEYAVNFEPRALPPRNRLVAPHARYELQVPAWPPGTARIRVVAEDQPHAHP